MLGFFKVLISGNLSLYRFNNQFFIEGESGSLKQVSIEEIVEYPNGVKMIGYSTHHIKVLKDMMSNCDKVHTLPIKDVKMNEKSLKQLVSAYNMCIGSEQTVYEAKKYPAFNYGFYIGGGKSTIQNGEIFTKSESERKWTAGNVYTIGMVYTVSVSKNLRGLSFISGINVNKATYHYRVHNIRHHRLYTDTSFDITEIALPIGLRYEIESRKNINLFFNAGGMYSYVVHGNTKSQRFDNLSPNRIFPIENHEEHTKNRVGAMAGLGVNFPLDRHNKGFVEFRHSLNEGISFEDKRNFEMNGTTLRNYQLLLGIMF